MQALNRAEMAKRMADRSRRAAAEGRVPWAESFRRLTFGDVSPPRRSAALAAQAKEREEQERAEAAARTEQSDQPEQSTPAAAPAAASA